MSNTSSSGTAATQMEEILREINMLFDSNPGYVSDSSFQPGFGDEGISRVSKNTIRWLRNISTGLLLYTWR